MINEVIIKAALERFQYFLQVTDSVVSECSKISFEEFKSNFVQANWELIVEYFCAFNAKSELFLEVYSEGADGENGSSRITYPNKLPTHRLLFRPEDDKVMDCLNNSKLSCNIVFQSFVTMKDDWYLQAAPFDCVLGVDENNKCYVFKSSCVKWCIESI